MNIDDFTNRRPVDRTNVERHKERMLKYTKFWQEMWGEWGELAFAWTPTKTTQGWVWLRRVWRFHQVDGRIRYEKARSK